MLLRTKLILHFLVVVLITGAVAAAVGVFLIGGRIVSQAQNKVRMDLNSAWEVYNQRERDVADAVRHASIRHFLRDAIIREEWGRISAELEQIRMAEGLDVLTLTDEKGVVVVRARNPKSVGDSQAKEQIIVRVLSTREVVCGTQIVARGELVKEGEDLAERARTRFVTLPGPSREMKKRKAPA